MKKKKKKKTEQFGNKITIEEYNKECDRIIKENSDKDISETLIKLLEYAKGIKIKND